MHRNNPHLRSENEKIEYDDDCLKEFIKCKEDIIYFAEHYVNIITIDRGKELIKLYDYQKKMLSSFYNPPKNKRHNVVLSSRQIGKSTISIIFILHYILFNKDKNVAILANKQETAIKLLSMLKHSYESLPLWLQQGIMDDGWNAKTIKLENGTRVLASSTSSSAIRGETISLLFLDEFAFVPDHIAEEFMMSVMPTISSGETSKIIIVSTPNGLNHFYAIWKKSLLEGEKGNGFNPIKVNWYEVPGRDQKFKKNTIKNLAGGEREWNQEFGAKFIGSNSTLIDPNILESMTYDDPVESKQDGIFQIYEKSIPGVTYFIGVDTASGSGLNFSVCHVLKINSEKSIEQVAIYRSNQIGTYDFAQVCINISVVYNNALLMIESNSEGGEVLTTIWHFHEYTQVCNMDKHGLGIRSTKQSKLNANLLLKEYLEKGFLKLHDKNTIQELSHYVEVTPHVYKSESESNNDDCVTSLIWGLWTLRTPYFDPTDITDKRLEMQERTDEPPVMILDDSTQVPKDDEFGSDFYTFN